MQRKDGFYWAKYSGEWIVCCYNKYDWSIPGNECDFTDSDFEEIDERQIKHRKKKENGHK